jgi:hypothetical protein
MTLAIWRGGGPVDCIGRAIWFCHVDTFVLAKDSEHDSGLNESVCEARAIRWRVPVTLAGNADCRTTASCSAT